MPHIKNNNYNLVVDIHSNQGRQNGGNYDETNFIFAPKNQSSSKTIAMNIISKIPELCYYYPASQTSPPYMTEPLVNAGINTIIYETYIYESATTTNALMTKLVNTVDTYDFNSGSSGSGSLSLDSIKDAATRVEAYVINNGVLPNTVEIGGKSYSMPDFLYLLSAAIVNINKGSTGNINPISVLAPSGPSGNSMVGDLQKSEFVTLATNVLDYIVANKQAPNYASSALGKIQFQSLVFQFSRILEFADSNGRLPNYLTVNIKTTDTLNGGSGSSSGGSTPTGYLAQYLKATKNCQVNDAKIQSLAAQLTSGLTSDLAKATAIFNYVRDNVQYKFYYDSYSGGNGAVGVLSRNWANCVDKSHLLNALMRASGIPARHVNGKVTFTISGYIGHTWAEVYVNGQWLVADTTSSNNRLGYVSNWKSPSTIYGRYAEITF